MDWIKNLSLKKSFFAIITTSLIAAIVLSVLFSSLCNALIDHTSIYMLLFLSKKAALITRKLLSRMILR